MQTLLQPAFPADGIVSLVWPSSFALDTAAPRPLALKEPVGFTPSSLMYTVLRPVAFARRSALRSGVPPSPNAMMLASSMTGMTSR